MRDGFKIYDSDTHLSPMAKTLELYFDAACASGCQSGRAAKFHFVSAGPTKFPTPLSPPLPPQLRKEPGYRDLWDNRFIGRTASHPGVQ